MRAAELRDSAGIIVKKDGRKEKQRGERMADNGPQQAARVVIR